jgi:hypothetical protein
MVVAACIANWLADATAAFDPRVVPLIVVARPDVPDEEGLVGRSTLPPEQAIAAIIDTRPAAHRIFVFMCRI